MSDNQYGTQVTPAEAICIFKSLKSKDKDATLNATVVYPNATLQGKTLHGELSCVVHADEQGFEYAFFSLTRPGDPPYRQITYRDVNSSWSEDAIVYLQTTRPPNCTMSGGKRRRITKRSRKSHKSRKSRRPRRSRR